ncbi:hypothetical protein ZOSMA_57G00780 [Zostera marina]|uniref:Uncharacterized protein n=1 Tax=Zostera marina TaxID=29655 RepID=A0A0K9NVF6_ZOSMR|nr:hypothetical protein ZOSMA_57G00780 [Zostera marina]
MEENVDSMKSRSRLDLAEQLREYQIRSKQVWETVSFYSSTSNIDTSPSQSSSSRGLGAILVIAATTSSLLYLRYSRFAFSFLCVATFMWFVYLRIANKGTRRKRGLLLPLSM